MTEKYLPAGALTRQSQADQAYVSYFEIIRDSVAFAEFFYPQYWKHHKTTRPLSIIRLRDEMGTYDFDVVVRSQVPGGLVVEYRGGRAPANIKDPYEAANAALTDSSKLKVAPMGNDGKPAARLQFLPKTKWRVIGLDSQEVSRNHETEIEGRRALDAYLQGLFMRNPTAEEIEAYLAAKESAPA